jgi:hypothetical protein
MTSVECTRTGRNGHPSDEFIPAAIGGVLAQGGGMSAFISRSIRYRAGVTSALVLALLLGSASAQTKITPDKNSFSPQDDVKLGQEAAAEVRKQMPLVHDNRVDSFVEGIGRRLVAVIPPDLRQPAFRYTFEVVNQKEINAFALPGGPMFLNRGMIEAAKTDGEVAGVMAHELSHVILRHGTAQATKAQKFQIGAVAGQVLGAIVGGTAGSIISQGSQFGLGTYFMKYSREYERQADLMGSHLMAAAGYDPRQMANMFRTIEQEGGRGGPEWLSDHPNPGNRYEAINREAGLLQVQGSAGSQAEFNDVRGRLQAMGPAPSGRQRASAARGNGNGAPVGTAGSAVRVQPPAGEFQTHNAGGVRVSVPSNWRAIGGNGTVTYAPEGGFYQAQNGGTAFTHGVEIGVLRTDTANLQQATDELLQGFARNNPQLRRESDYRRDSVGGRQGLTTTLTNVSDVTGQPEYISVATTRLRDGGLLYVIGVSPRQEAGTYDPAFRRIRQSLEIAEGRSFR